MGVLKRDPTRTTGIRKQFMADIKRRFKWLAQRVVEHVVIDDSYGLGPNPITQPNGLQTINAREFEFLTASEKVKHFRQWLKAQVDAGILQVADEFRDKPWMATYVESSYKKGLTRAYVDSKVALGLSQTQAAFLVEAFSAPAVRSKLELLYTRSFEGLNGITNQMSNQMNRIFADAVAAGKGPREVARELVKEIEGMTNKRALTLARTEIIHVHAEGQLDSFDRLGIEELQVEIEFSTAGDDRVCPICQSMEGQIFKDTGSARNIIPLHPNCRCAWIPYFPKTAKKKATTKKAKAPTKKAKPAKKKAPIKKAKAPIKKAPTDEFLNFRNKSNAKPNVATPSKATKKKSNEVIKKERPTKPKPPNQGKVVNKPQDVSHPAGKEMLKDKEAIALMDKQMEKANQFREVHGLPPLDKSDYVIKEVRVSSLRPTQAGEDYINPSSQYLTSKITKYNATGRKEDYLPVLTDHKGNVLDGNHRHAAHTMAGQETILAFVPKK